MTDPQDIITVHSVDENVERKSKNVFRPSCMNPLQQKHKTYRLKDAALEVRARSKKTTFGSDPLILAAHDLKYHQRYNTCSEYCCRRGYRAPGMPDLRRRHERPVHQTPYHSGLGFVGNRLWTNASSADMLRPYAESHPNPTRRRYLPRSLTSSELMGPSYKRCLPAIPLQKSQKNSLYGSSKSVHSYDCVQPKTDPTAVLPKFDNENENQPISCISDIPTGSAQIPNSSASSSHSDGSIGDPKTPSTVSTLPMGSGSPKHNDAAAGQTPVFGSQFSLTGSHFCQNCQSMPTIPCHRRTTSMGRWHSQSTVGEGHYVPADGSNDGLSWRRLHMSRAKLKATATTSELLSGFAMVAMVELQINEPTNVPEWLFVIFSVTTTVLVAVHIFALMISTYLLPNIDAASKLHSEKLFTESPHERMKGFIELAWAFSTVLGLFLFLVEVAILCWVKFWDFSIRAAMAATIIVIPVLIIFIVFVYHFWRVLVVHKCKSTIKSIHELEEMRKKLDNVSPV